MKIAVFHSSRALVGADSSGSGIYETSLAKVLDLLSSETGLEIVHFVPRRFGARFRRLEKDDNTVFEFRSGLVERVASLWPHSFLAQVIEASPLMSTARFLRSSGFDLAYFSSPSPLALRLGSFPYLFTVWDFGHLDLPGFTEVWAQSVWVRRERIYSLGIGRAMHIMVDSEKTGIRLEDRYGIPRNRWTSIGLLPNAQLGSAKSREIAHDYVIYPAKFWPHKNHSVLLEALSLLKSRGVKLKLVLTGSDGGNLRLVQARIRSLGLEEDVLIVGQIGRQRLLGLISNAVALVMPSLLGPTNLPPLEALQLGVPTIVSDEHNFGLELDAYVRKVPALDIDGWANEIQTALQEPKQPGKIVAGDRLAIQSLSSIFDHTKIMLGIAQPK